MRSGGFSNRPPVQARWERNEVWGNDEVAAVSVLAEAFPRTLALVIFTVAVAVGAPASGLGQDIEQAAAEIAEQWAAGDVSRLQSRFSQDGVRLQWEARPLGVLAPRHAGASIREYLDNREAASARVSRVEELGGEPRRGFAELRWESRIRGMSEMVTRTVFVAFVYEDGAWRVAELRVLPRTRL